MNDSKNTNDFGGINISGSQVGGFAVGDNANISSIIQSLPIQHPQANQLKQKLVELQKTINASDIADFKKRNALSSVEQLVKELRKKKIARSSVRNQIFPRSNS